MDLVAKMPLRGTNKRFKDKQTIKKVPLHFLVLELHKLR